MQRSRTDRLKRSLDDPAWMKLEAMNQAAHEPEAAVRAG
jgi:hypothetical protein